MSLNGYKKLLRPILFRFDAERVHEWAKVALRQEPLWRWLGRSCRVDDPRLQVQLGGLRVPNPVGLSAGFDKDCEVLAGLQHLGFGYLVPGSVMPHTRQGNPKDRPRILRLPEQESMLNCLGLPSQGLAYAVEQLKRFRHSSAGQTPIIVNFGANTLDEYLACYEALQPLADAIEVNLRCPNARDDEGDFLRPRMYERLLTELIQRKQKPLFIKLQTASSRQEEEERLDLVQRGVYYGIDGYTIPGTWSVKDDRLSIGRGNLTGRAVFEKTLETVRALWDATDGKVAIKARGGIFSGEDAFRAIAAGASSVDLLTAFIYEGWHVAREINLDLLRRLNEEGIPDLTALRGSAVQTKWKPAAHE